MDVYKNRRKVLLESTLKKYPVSKGVIILFSNFEDQKRLFRQESSFSYLTGIEEPGVVFCIFSDGREILYAPEYTYKRDQWVVREECSDTSVEKRPLGQACKGYWIKPFYVKEEYENLFRDVTQYIGTSGAIFSLLDQTNDAYFSSITRCKSVFSSYDKIVDVAPLVSVMRRKKDPYELQIMQKAVDVTCYAQEHVAGKIAHGLYEYNILAEVEWAFISRQARASFPSIVATGINSTVLHYTKCDKLLERGDVLVVDIGAEVGNYCADLTRTYPVGKKFSPRQRDIYNIVLEVQDYIAQQAKPGTFLVNADAQEISLHHLAKAFLKQKGYDHYFIHGIGHFLGLDVHDVGDVLKPLGQGDVITIEPGIYIPEESIGIRIEDDFVITDKGCRCLSQNLVKCAEDIEGLR
jgi:Xaa-Pro aminopeptidase